MVRIENIRISGGPISVDLSTLLPGKNIASLQETTLDGNLHLEDLKRLKWKTKNEDLTHPKNKKIERHIVDIEPKQIRSFLLKLN